MSVETNPHNYTNMNLIFSQFLPARIPPKEISGANGKFLPKPLLFHLRHPNSKTNQPKFWQTLSPKNSFAKTSSALKPHARGACEVITSLCFGNRCEFGTIQTPEWNLAVENQPRSGRAVGTPTLFRPFSPMNSDSRLRRDGLFFRQEAGAKSEAILTTNLLCPKYKKNFYHYE